MTGSAIRLYKVIVRILFVQRLIVIGIERLCQAEQEMRTDAAKISYA